MYRNFVTVCVDNDCIELTEDAVMIYSDGGEPQKVSIGDYFFIVGVRDFNELTEYADANELSLDAVIMSVHGREW